MGPCTAGSQVPLAASAAVTQQEKKEEEIIMEFVWYDERTRGAIHFLQPIDHRSDVCYVQTFLIFGWRIAVSPKRLRDICDECGLPKRLSVGGLRELPGGGMSVTNVSGLRAFSRKKWRSSCVEVVDYDCQSHHQQRVGIVLFSFFRQRVGSVDFFRPVDQHLYFVVRTLLHPPCHHCLPPHPTIFATMLIPTPFPLSAIE